MNKKKEESRALKNGVFMLTSACNLRCDYCFEYEHAARHMSKETALQGIRWLLATANTKACFILFGGEPLLRKDLIPWFIETAQTEARESGKQVTFSMSTNGTLFDREIGDVLKRAGAHIRLSADGTAEVNDIHRKFADNRGAYHLVEKAIPLIKDVCASPSVRMTVTPQNVYGMADGVEHFVSLGFNTVHPVPNIEDRWTPDKLKLYAENIERIGALFIHHLLKERYLSIYGITDVINRATRRPKTYLCGAGRSMVAIDTDGAVFPCQRFIGYSTSDPKWRLGDIWKGFDEEKREYFYNLTLDNMKSCKETSSGLCQGCDIFHICSGGCPAVNQLITGDPCTASSSYQAFKSMCIDEVHGIVTFLQSKYPHVWETYITRLASTHGKQAKDIKNKKRRINYE